MPTTSEGQGSLGSVRRLRLLITLGALAIALTHVLWPGLSIDAVTLTLLVVAILPWLAPIFKSLQFPGGWKVEFQELQKAAERADEAGLLAAAPAQAAPEFTFQRVVEEDPNLALAGLRIEIEKRLVRLAESRHIEFRNRGIAALLRVLAEHRVLESNARSVLADMTGLLNSAVHGATVDPRATDWAIDVGPRLLQALDDLIGQWSGD